MTPSTNIEPHPGRFELLIPFPSEEDYQRLKADIQRNGIQMPILVTRTGEIIDGHTRHRIATELGIECPFTVSDAADKDVMGLALSLNLARRHLTDTQKVMIGLKMESAIRKALRSTQDFKGKWDTQKEVAERIAQIVGLPSGGVYQRHRQQVNALLQEAPSLRGAVENGEIVMRDIRQLLDIAPFLIPFYEQGFLNIDQLRTATRLYTDEYDNYPLLIEAMLNPGDQELLDPFDVDSLIIEFKCEPFASMDDVDAMTEVIARRISIPEAIEQVRSMRSMRYRNHELELVLAAARTMATIEPESLPTASFAYADIIEKCKRVLDRIDPIDERERGR